MDRYAVITIDTESDHSRKSWHKANILKFDSVLAGIPKRLQPLLNRYRAVPTYLLAIEVIESSDCVKCLKSLPGNYELGTHLHPEYVEPYKKYFNYEDSLSKDFACNLDPDEEFLKLKTITEMFIKNFGYHPTSYRAGRFGAGTNTIRSLQKLGYKVDTSVTPYSLWDGKDGLDFTGYPDSLYFPSLDDISKTGDSSILEVPVTIKPRRYLSKDLTFLVERNSWLKHIPLVSSFVYKYLCPVWLQPAFSSAREMIQVVDSIVEGNKEGLTVINIMFHSMEIIGGIAPTAPTEGKARTVLDRIDKLLSYLNKNKFKFISLSKLYDEIVE